MKKQITLRIDEGLLSWFKLRGKGYQSEMHKALEKYRRLNSPALDVDKYYEDEPEKPEVVKKDAEVEIPVHGGVIKTVNDIPRWIKRSYSKAEQLGKKK